MEYDVDLKYPKNHKYPKYHILMQFDPDANILSIEVSQGEISHAREFGNFIIHMSRVGKPILIEILDASSFIGQMDKIKGIKGLEGTTV